MRVVLGNHTFVVRMLVSLYPLCPLVRERGLLRDDFEDGVGIGDVHESIRAQHQAEQHALAAVIGRLDVPTWVRSAPLKTTRRILPPIKSAKSRLLR
jgi:hypothetical protein